jgi:hypothetical protein
MPGSDPSMRYCAYLLRCWTEHSGHAEHLIVWRFSVEDPHTGERQGFATFEQLLAFLRQGMDGAPYVNANRPDHAGVLGCEKR